MKALQRAVVLQILPLHCFYLTPSTVNELGKRIMSLCMKKVELSDCLRSSPGLHSQFHLAILSSYHFPLRCLTNLPASLAARDIDWELLKLIGGRYRDRRQAKKRAPWREKRALYRESLLNSTAIRKKISTHGRYKFSRSTQDLV